VIDQCLFQAVHAERRVHAVADAPGQHAPRIPVDSALFAEQTLRIEKCLDRTVHSATSNLQRRDGAIQFDDRLDR
jgi:hypothetical protein